MHRIHDAAGSNGYVQLVFQTKDNEGAIKKERKKGNIIPTL